MNIRLVVLVILVVVLIGFGIGYFALTPKVDAYSPIQVDHLSNATAIEIHFTRPMQAASVEENLTIEPQVEGEITWPDERTLRFTPTVKWDSGTQVDVRLESGSRSNIGLVVRQPLEYSFQISPVLLLYLWPSTGGSDIYAIDLDNAATEQLTASGNITSFDTSPDGRLAYYFVDNNITGNDLFVLNRYEALTAESESSVGPVRLLTCQRALCSEPAVSPNGTLLAYQRNDSEIWLLDLESLAEPVQISPEGDESRLPLWSPNGALSYYNADLQAYILLDVDSGDETIFPNNTGEDGAWSPGGTAFIAPEAFTIETNILRGPSGEADNQEIPEEELEPVRVLAAHLLVYQTSGSQVQNLSADQLVEDFSPAFSPDGRTLAFTRRYLTEEPITLGRQVWLMPVQGSPTQARALTDHPDYKYTVLAWHPNGTQLAVVRANQALLTEPPEIWLLNLDGSAVRLVIGGYAPQWIP